MNVHEAKTTLSQLMLEVDRGEEVTIARNDVPVARLTGMRPVARREPGLWRRYPDWENFAYDPAVLAPMTDEEMEDEGWSCTHYRLCMRRRRPSNCAGDDVAWANRRNVGHVRGLEAVRE